MSDILMGLGENTTTQGIAPTTLSELLAPMSESEFVGSYLGERFCFINGSEGKFSQLLPWDVLNNVLTQHRLDYPRLRIVKNGEVLPPSRYLSYQYDRRGAKYARVRPTELVQEVRSGALLHLASVDEVYESLSDLKSQLEQSLRGEVFINAMLGTNKSTGFDTHWDSHDVFVVQVAGRKMWRIFGFTDPFPIRNVMDDVRSPRGSIWEGVIEAGDLLYMPRGCWHSAQALEGPSLHLTIGIDNPTGLDLLDWIRTRLRYSDIFRKDLPSHRDEKTQSQHLALLRAELMKLWTDNLLEEFTASHSRNLGKMDVLDLP